MWLGRRYRSARAWFGRQSYPVRASVGCAGLFVLLCSPGWCCIGGALARNAYRYCFVYTAEDRAFVRSDRGGYHEGLPSVARRLKAEVEQIPNPDEALKQHPDWFGVRFSNGEWAFGHGINSHGFQLGSGTFVVKDSRGRVRIFFGHVCGPNAGVHSYPPQHWKSLDDFDKDWWPFGTLREWVPDQ